MPKTYITIKDLELNLHLGWPITERAKPQTININIDIYFNTVPNACISDELTDTFCYAKLITAIQAQTLPKEFKLIEHLAHEIYRICQETLPKGLLIKVAVSKKPIIPGFIGSVAFHYGDDILN